MISLGLYINPPYYKEKKVNEVLQNLYKYKLKNLSLYALKEQLDILPDFVNEYDESKGVTLSSILVFGGDGTILRAKSFAIKTGAPLLGINIGKLGFLSETTPKQLEKSIDYLLNNRYKVQTRMLLSIKVYRKKEVIYQGLALNDAVLFRAITPKMIEVKIKTNNHLIYTTRCDGLVASTPTGSTAYSLSGGGPILDPLMDAVVFCPLNPHILSIRPIVFSSKDVLSFELISCFNNPQLQVDGVNKISLNKGDIIKITASDKRVPFVKLSNKTFYQILRKKMHMGKI